jgi:hypothetical protein
MDHIRIVDHSLGVIRFSPDIPYAIYLHKLAFMQQRARVCVYLHWKDVRSVDDNDVVYYVIAF